MIRWIIIMQWNVLIFQTFLNHLIILRNVHGEIWGFIISAPFHQNSVVKLQVCNGIKSNVYTVLWLSSLTLFFGHQFPPRFPSPSCRSLLLFYKRLFLQFTTFYPVPNL